ncbi:hypothetical protein BS297_09285 [Rhodococcus erythropolis]|uniref:Uncharacterized protein n=1 Tax=Rhodococcus erythropolis TaxID=1833 RepID=A0A5N5E645_RHOER|nr:hypothetical protein [Rhodococcus sp. (in: high G+C Gram-positive bacteria)]KAB2585657.1 hypothetical protein BS297_09285 [Rhodococcus erythropolis]RZL24909.1 MAG: hypothetical protein EOP31_11400 [Rhodococcus sp. (in: high G+C Gram-positive bacteria)]
MTETPSSGAESEANSQHEEIGVDTLELTLKLPQKTLTRLFRMGELSGVSTDEIAHRALEEYARHHFDYDTLTTRRDLTLNEP